ncbi:ATP-binding protein [Ferribacterium limneticum]|uniref:ATP-binding protein n=1 Tax=Ferribacterium limneticum TaxID=76259 RepID=UPI001CF8198A|nr:ATP-binding protein [Ferribacterium limneticum]UCV23826.1 ATP-binding protein [Ferribacterium limneticum]
MSNAQVLFQRPELANRFAKQILVIGVGSAASSGVFLAAPRRTGKSTFVREDLRPALEAEGALVVYADLWANPTADPGNVIVNAIRGTLASNDGVVLRLAKSAGLDKVKVGSVSFDLDRVGLGKDVSLTEALVALSDETKKIIVLVIDEAQHAITTEAGVSALFALKAARDELNSSQHHGLRVVCTGSNRDKLAMLRNSKDQAFFGAPLVNFPMLGKDYIEWFCKEVDLPFQLDPKQVLPLFVEAGYRPEVIGAAADRFRFDFEIDVETGADKFAEEVRRLTDEMNQVQLGVIHSLTPIQSSVLRVMAAARENYAPFEAATLEKYRKAMTQAGLSVDDAKADVPGVQQALIALQEKKLVWKAARGVYAIEEQSIFDLLKASGQLDGLE